MNDPRRQKADLLLEIHEFNEAKTLYETEKKRFDDDVERLRGGGYQVEFGRVDSILNNYPTKDRFEVLVGTQAELDRKSKNLESRKKKFGL